MVDLPEPERPVKKIVTPCLSPWRIAEAQLLHNFRISEPCRNVAALVKAPAQFGAGDVEDLRALRNFIGGDVAVFILEIDHHLERNHFDAHFALVFLEEFLRIVGAVEVLTVGIFSRTGMVAADDEVGAAVILANQAVPDGFARSAHAHGERQHGELHGAVRIFREQQLVAAGADEIIDVAGLGHADGRMDEQIGFDLLGGAHGEFDVGAMHRITRLEGDDAGPAEAGEFGAQFGGSQAQGAEIVVGRRLHSFDFSADVPGIRFVDGVVGAGVGAADGTENGLGFGFFVGLPHVFDVEDGEHYAFGIAQGDLAAAGG